MKTPTTGRQRLSERDLYANPTTASSVSTSSPAPGQTVYKTKSVRTRFDPHGDLWRRARVRFTSAHARARRNPYVRTLPSVYRLLILLRSRRRARCRLASSAVFAWHRAAHRYFLTRGVSRDPDSRRTSRNISGTTTNSDKRIPSLCTRVYSSWISRPRPSVKRSRVTVRAYPSPYPSTFPSEISRGKRKKTTSTAEQIWDDRGRTTDVLWRYTISRVVIRVCGKNVCCTISARRCRVRNNN